MMKLARSVSAIMPLITTVPSIRRPAAPDPVAIHNGTHPRMKANEVIKSGRRRSRAPSNAASTRLRPFSSSTLANFNDQDCVLCRQSYQNDQTDLSVHIQVKAAEPQAGEGSEDRNWYRQ